jgi:hypothetical protein
MAVPPFIAILEAEARFRQLTHASRLANERLRSTKAATHAGVDK